MVDAWSCPVDFNEPLMVGWYMTPQDRRDAIEARVLLSRPAFLQAWILWAESPFRPAYDNIIRTETGVWGD